MSTTGKTWKVAQPPYDPPTGESLAWLAGLLEGEGYFGAEANHHGGRHVYARIVLGMTDGDVVERAAAMMGTKVYLRPRQREGWSPTYFTGVHGFRAIALCKALAPFMGARRKTRIQEVIAACDRDNRQP